jgi:hypothetical protein
MWEITDEIVAEVERLRSKLDALSGAGMANGPHAIALDGTSLITPAQDQPQIAIVKLTAASGTGGGVYNATAFYAKTNGTSTSLVDSDLGTAGASVIAWNLAEVGSSSPAISSFPAYGLGVLAGLNASSGKPVYAFSAAARSGTPAKITAADSGAGQYTATLYAGTTTAISGTALSLPAGLTAGATVTVANLDESGLTGNRLAIGSWVYAYPTSSPTVFWSHGGVGSRDTPKSLPYSDPTSTTADTTTWSRDTDGLALNLIEPRIVWDSTALVLHVFTRKKYFDARGLLYKVDGEIDAPVTFTNCTAGS